jgi:hypothetical protein
MNDLMMQLEFPACKKFMVPPIFLCERRHNIRNVPNAEQYCRNAPSVGTSSSNPET